MLLGGWLVLVACYIALRACCGVLRMSVPDAVEHIGHCEPHSLRYFEAGERASPLAVIERMCTVLERRASVYNKLNQLAVQFSAQSELCAQGKILPF